MAVMATHHEVYREKKNGINMIKKNAGVKLKLVTQTDKVNICANYKYNNFCSTIESQDCFMVSILFNRCLQLKLTLYQVKNN